MIRVKMKTISAGPNGVLHPDTTYPVDETFAKALVSGGYAEYETAMLVKEKPVVTVIPDALKQVITDVAPGAKPASPKKAVQPWDK